MGHAGASRKSPNDAPWETLSLRLSRPYSAPLLTVARSWRHEEEEILMITTSEHSRGQGSTGSRNYNNFLASWPGERV